MPALPSINCEDRRRVVQPHGVCCVWLGVLLAVQEGDHGPALSESIGMHLLGHEAVVAQEEAAVAVGDARRCAGDDCARRRHRRARHDYRLVPFTAARDQTLIKNFSRNPRVGRTEAPHALQGRQQAQAELRCDGRRCGIGKFIDLCFDLGPQLIEPHLKDIPHLLLLRPLCGDCLFHSDGRNALKLLLEGFPIGE